MFMNAYDMSILDGFSGIYDKNLNPEIRFLGGGFVHDLNFSWKAEKFHSHDFYEISFVKEGEIVYIVEGREEKVLKDHFIVMPPKTKHEIIYHSNDFLKVSVVFEVNNMMLKNVMDKYEGVHETTVEMNETMNFIVKKIKAKNAFTVMIINRLTELVYFAAECGMEWYKKSILLNERDSRLITAKEYITTNPRKFFTCSEVADYCGLSEKQLNRLFIKYEGKSVSAFLYEKKISDCKKVIRNSGLPQAEIAKRLGFSSSSYYMKFFKKHVGITPNEYRSQYSSGDDFDII